jgi:catechol-2,3-dioxygenase
MELNDLRINIEKTKGALDYYEELLSSEITEIELARQRLSIVKNEILELTMKTEQAVKQLENQIIK